MTVIIGIDPGMDGAIAVLVDGELAELHPMPCTLTLKRSKGKTRRIRTIEPDDIEEITTIMRSARRHCVCGESPIVAVEKVNARYGEAAQGSFRFGQAAMAVTAVPIALGYYTTLVPANVWKPAVGASKDKKRSLTLAAHRFPTWSDSFLRITKDTGVAEAALIAAWRHNVRETDIAA